MKTTRFFNLTEINLKRNTIKLFCTGGIQQKKCFIHDECTKLSLINVITAEFNFQVCPRQQSSLVP